MTLRYVIRVMSRNDQANKRYVTKTFLSIENNSLNIHSDSSIKSDTGRLDSICNSWVVCDKVFLLIALEICSVKVRFEKRI